jgi:small conductance mechanosensitive channel
LVIWGSAFLISLAVFGLDIGPLLASAGIVGVAVGFGAQTLVKDYISGLFLILEDQFGIGDIVEFGTVKGKVESVALRTTRVRDETGVLWYVRNGEILNVANHSQTINREK